MKRRYRLSKSSDFQRVRRQGKSYAHPLAVLVYQTNGENFTRWGVVAGKSVGGAVQRNRAKRVLRAASQLIVTDVKEGWDLILIARRPVVNADFSQVYNALVQLINRAGLIRELNDQ